MSPFAFRFLLSSTKSNGFNSIAKLPSLAACHGFNSIAKQPSLSALTRSQLRFYSAKDSDDDVSTEELRMRIQKYYDGDEEALPSIVEGIMKRKLSGKHEESDDELMNEIQEFNSDSSGEFETDEE
ncbi:hypothetical protein COLO4_38537 [Corchorus olitorius]|uniref:Uncharacterized protein n=1 Tax=Corchorus olitorius TaxID=93759 RepID=A0A1R3FUD2_9ROSI|nr:hypothetical protein COLO4_38537 [Corchorus olitorius]